jgi:hypothetical protein
MVWYYKNEEVIDLPEVVGFVYKITNKISGRAYLGKKLKFFTKAKMIIVTLKSGVKKKKKVKTQVESDWRTYWSSSVELQNDVKELGEENFTREILFYCQSKGNLSYIELREQILNKVLEDSTLWYNGIIQAKIHRNHVRL